MLLLPINALKSFYFTRLLNVIMQNYLLTTTTCIIWPQHANYTINWDGVTNPTAAAIVNIHRRGLYQSFGKDVVDFVAKRKDLLNDYIVMAPLVEKLTMSLEKSHCESFLVFQLDISTFIESITNASRYSIWRSSKNKFVFVYNNNEGQRDFLQHRFFEEQSSILLIETFSANSEIFDLKTNKYIGPQSENQKQLYLLDTFNASSNNFLYGRNLFPDKFVNLQGREVIMSAFDYRPDIVFKYYPGAISRDRSFEADDIAGDVEIDGTEAKILLTFCEKHNCTVHIDTSAADDWGTSFRNMSGVATLGMVAKRKAEICMSAMYTWYVDYMSLDMSMYLGRSGITCVVPAPKRLASWLLPIEPFQPLLWTFVFGCLCIEILALSFLDHFRALLKFWGLKLSVLVFGKNWRRSFRYAFSTTLLLFISQSNRGATVNFTPLRVMLFACFLNDIVITSIYSGGLASILTVPSFSLAADSLERFNAFQLKWAADSEAWVASIRNDENEIIKGLLRNFNIYSEEELIELAKRGDMGFTIERLPYGHFAVQEHLTSTVLNKMKIMIEDIYFQYTVAYTARMWPLMDRFNEMVIMWHSSGLDKFWEWHIVAEYLDGDIQKQLEASQYMNTEDIGPVKLGMSNFVGMLLLWMLGVVCATLVFLAELLMAHMKAVRVNK